MSTILLAALLLFPTIEGSSLSGRHYVIPKDLDGRARILLVAFKRDQQINVNTWLPLVREITEADTSLRYYELPVIGSGYSIMRFMIDGGMRRGIKDPKARESTITVYTITSPFRKALSIPNDELIQVFLLDRNGYVRWRAEDSMTPAKANELKTALAALLIEQPR